MTSKHKVKHLDECLTSLNKLRTIGKKVVFTNGCFDILHSGHIACLEAAKNFGDILIIGVNSDTSVARLKGPGRPIKDQHTRSTILAALAAVDIVVIFDTDTPIDLITAISPDVLVKGGDYTAADIVGADFVLARGGEVRIVEYVEGHSSTRLIDKMTR